MQLLHRISRQMRKTVFLSTHDLDLALQLADKVWLMGQGGRLSGGTPEDLTLDGTMARFIVRKGVAFDEQEGLFRVEHECVHLIRLLGEGLRAEMIKKALRRNGIEAGSEVQSDVCVEVREGEYVLTCPGRSPQAATSVEGLLRLLMSISFS